MSSLVSSILCSPAARRYIAAIFPHKHCKSVATKNAWSHHNGHICGGFRGMEKAQKADDDRNRQAQSVVAGWHFTSRRCPIPIM